MADHTGYAARPISIDRQTIGVNALTAAKGRYRHFMLKEIMEQPEAAMSALRGRLEFAQEAIT